MLGKPDIEEEALRRVFLLTKGCPLYLRAIREGDEATLQAHSRFEGGDPLLALLRRRLAVIRAERVEEIHRSFRVSLRAGLLPQRVQDLRNLPVPVSDDRRLNRADDG